MNAIDVVGITRRFEGITAVDRVSFSVAPGEFLACVGHNGAGKTSLLNLISGVEVPDAGTVSVFGKRVVRHDPEEYARCGLARTFQKPTMFRRLSVLETMLVSSSAPRTESILAALLGPASWRRREREHVACAEALLDQLGIAHLRDRSGEALSGGERKLVELAAVLVRRPRVLLLDEPAPNLSGEARARVRSVLAERRRQGMATVVVEHERDFLEGLATTVIVLGHGKLIRSGPFDERPATAERAVADG